VTSGYELRVVEPTDIDILHHCASSVSRVSMVRVQRGDTGKVAVGSDKTPLKTQGEY
jgi:hypothetical protein